MKIIVEFPDDNRLDYENFSWLMCPFMEQEELEDHTHEYLCFCTGKPCVNVNNKGCPIINVER